MKDAAVLHKTSFFLTEAFETLDDAFNFCATKTQKLADSCPAVPLADVYRINVWNLPMLG